MVLHGRNIRKNDLDAALLTVKTEIDLKSAELETIIVQIRDAKAAFADLEQQKADFEAYKAETEAKFKEEEINQHNSRLDVAVVRANLNVDIDRASVDLRALNKELARLNAKCLSAHAESEELNAQIAAKQARILELTDIAANLSSVEVSFAQLLEKKAEHDNKVVSEIAEYQGKIAAAELELTELSAEKDKVALEAEQAKYALKSYTDQLYLAMNDWHTIRTRLETRFKEHYPELDMPVANI